MKTIKFLWCKLVIFRTLVVTKIVQQLIQFWETCKIKIFGIVTALERQS